MLNNLVPYVTDTSIRDFDRKELGEVCNTLELEYRGGSTSLNANNIAKLVKGFKQAKISRFAIHTNIVGPIVDKENTTYINPPTRTYTTKNGGQVSKKLQVYIDDIYEQMQFDLFMAKAEKFTSLLGMTLFKPTFDDEDNTMNIIEMYPSNSSLELSGNPKFPGKVAVVSYKYKIGKTEYSVVIDKEKITTTYAKDGVATTDIDEHGLDMLPFAILKFKIDNSRVYGPPDYELYSLCKHRSLVLANTMARLHLSDLEKLMVTGADLETVLENMRERILAFPTTETDAAGNPVTPTAQFISPDGQDALNLLEAYFKLYQHIMDNRGHVQKIFSRGADVPSAESIRLGSIDLHNKQQEKKKFLSSFERGMFIRMIKENNRFGQNMQIPEDTQLVVNFKPEPYSFTSGSDEVAYFQAAITAKTETPINWIKNRNPELTDEEARQLYEENKKFFEDEAEDEPEPLVAPIAEAGDEEQEDDTLTSPEGGRI